MKTRAQYSAERSADGISRCPCCGQATYPSQLLVDLGNNYLAHGDAKVKVQPRIAELAKILVDAAPGWVHKQTIIARMFGGDEPENPEVTVADYACRLRGALWHVGHTVEGMRGSGYRVIRTGETR